MADRNLRFQSSSQGFNQRPNITQFAQYGKVPHSRPQGHHPVMQPGQGQMMNFSQGQMMNPGPGQMMQAGQGQRMPQMQGQMMQMGQGQMMQVGQGQMMNPGQGQMMQVGQGQMTPGQGQMMQPGQMMTGHMASQRHMMMPSLHGPNISQGQGQMMPQGQMFQARGPVPMNMVGMRMGPPPGPRGVAPPSYSQAHAASFQQRQKSVNSSGFHGNKNPNAGKTEEQLQKEKYFQQQQAKLKQFKTSQGSGLDPNKLIDSMFGAPDPTKHKPVKKEEVNKPEDSDDGFGDFLGSPEAEVTTQTTESQAVISVTTTTSSSQGNQPHQNQIPAPAPSAVPKQDKKDLAKMMLDSCDLTAPQKAKLFVKPSLKDLPSHTSAAGAHPILAAPSQGARPWKQAEELSDLFIQEAVKDEKTRSAMTVVAAKATSPTSKHPPKPPPWLSDGNAVPPLYKQVLEASVVDGHITTERLYPILMMSGLPKEVLGHLWSVCNKTTPGQLTTGELYQLLAVIALTQNNFKVESTDILSRCPQPPVPFFSPTSPSAGPGPFFAPGPGPNPALAMAPGHPVSTQGPMHPPGVAYPPVGPAHVAMATPVADTLSSAPGVTTHTVAAPVCGLPGQVSVQEAAFLGPSVGMMSSPATISVTNLPPAVTPQRSNIVKMPEENDDDFADFQEASPAAPATVVETSTPAIAPVVSASSTSKYVYKGTAEEKGTDGLSRGELLASTVENFFGTDDSSDVAKVTHRSIPATSPDDDYFDGYKSADSKPSDSTSQFSTDQSEGEDFKNFENYLDEFQRKKEQYDKESPLHRPIPKFSLSDNQPVSPSRIFPKAPVVTVQRIPMPGQLKVSQSKPGPVSSDEFSDFAEFQSAPPQETPAAAVQPALDVVKKSDDLKATGSASDLIGDEDKYAALRVLDFSEPPEEATTVFSEPEAEAAPAPATDEENWADFQAASNEEGASSKPVPESLIAMDDQEEDSDWAAFESVSEVVNTQSDYAGVSDTAEDMFSMSAKSSTDLFKDTAEPVKSSVPLHIAKSGLQAESEGSMSDDWADFQGGDTVISTSVNDVDFPKVTSSNNVTVDKKSEILGLFAAKCDIVPMVTPQAVPFETLEEPTNETDTSDLGMKMAEPSFVPEVVNPVKRHHFSEEDDFMKPPPMDDSGGVDDDDFGDGFGSFTRGYDLDHMHQPNMGNDDDNNKKLLGGIFRVNQTTVVTGHKKVTDNKEAADDEGGKAVSIEVTKYSGDLDKDNDSDSASSKDNDVFNGKFGLGKELGEDSQSVSSLDFVVNKRLQTLKDGDSQSMTSSEFGNFETGDASLPESKSVDSLELRKDFNSGSAENSDKDTKDESPERETKDESPVVFQLESSPSPTFPIVGDRYSSIMQDIQGSDKHAYEWQRCLSNCGRMIQDANNIFNSISSSSVCNEVMRSSQGSQYVQGVIEIYKVSCKIIVSMKKTGIHSDKLSELVKDIDLAWNNLTAFLVGGSVMPDDPSLDFSHGFLPSDDTVSRYKACGVCVLDVDLKAKGQGQVNDNANAKLTYGGRQYHSACANFWINCVDSTLPALKLPELL